MSKMNIRRIIKEEIDDFDWIRNAAINFEDVNLRVGDKFRVPTLNPDGSTFSIVTIIDIGLRGNEPITYRRESGMGQLQQRNLVDSKVDFIRRIIKDKWKPFYYNRGFKLYESDDFGWIRDVTPFNTGEKYVITIIDKPIEYKKKILDLLHDNRYYCSLEPILGGDGDIIDYELSDGFNLEQICYIVLGNDESLIYDDGYELSYLPCSNRGYTYEWVEENYGEEFTIISSEQLIKILNNPLNESSDLDWIKDVKPDVYTNQKLWNTRRHILYVVSDIRYGTEEWMTDSVHLTCPKWASESRLITLKRVQDLIEEGIFQDVTNLPPKDYIMESDDFDWVRDITPRVFDLLDIATKDNPRINVYFYEGDFIRILDRNGMNYFDAHDIGDYLGVESEEVYDISKEDLMRYILGNHILGGDWGGAPRGVVDPDNLKGNPLYVYNGDYRDYVDLYELVKTL